MAPILLTGASGYLGAAIGAALTDRGMCFDVLQGRLEDLTKRSLSGYQRVIHSAGAIRNRGEAAFDLFNRYGTEQLLAALHGDPEVLFISSRLVYGHNPAATCDEDGPLRPAETYGASKLAAERIVSDSGFPHVILRVPGLIGDSPSGIGHGFLADALRHFFTGQPVARYAPDRLHDSLDVRALARVCADWADRTALLHQGVFNVPGSSRSLHHTLAAFAQAAEQSGAAPVVHNRNGPESPWPFMSSQRFVRAGGSILQRPDMEIAQACCRAMTMASRS